MIIVFPMASLNDHWCDFDGNDSQAKIPEKKPATNLKAIFDLILIDPHYLILDLGMRHRELHCVFIFLLTFPYHDMLVWVSVCFNQTIYIHI